MDFKITKESLVYDLSNGDSTFSQTVSFENDSKGSRFFTVGLIINGEENIFYGTDKDGTDNVGDIWNVINICPNPFEKSITINGVKGDVFVYNSIGVEVFKIDLDSRNNIDLSFLSPGIYYLKSNNKYGSVVKK
jgi:hypothetical protein